LAVLEKDSEKCDPEKSLAHLMTAVWLLWKQHTQELEGQSVVRGSEATCI